MSRPAQLDRLPPQAIFAVSAGFHYLGPALAVLLFARVDVLGVAWLRIASAALVFAAWRRPWRLLTGQRRPHRRHLRLLIALGAVLAAESPASGRTTPGAGREGSTCSAARC